MAEPRPVGRPYSSARRRQQARQTQADILAAAERLFTTAGYAATTVNAVAAEAGVAPATVYAAFGSKAGLLETLIDRRLAGDDDPVALADRAEAKDALSRPDPRERIARAAALVRRVHDRALTLAEIAEAVDPDVTALTRVFRERRHRDTEAFVRAAAAVLSPGLPVERATDIAWALNSPEVYLMLVRDRGWTPDAYQRWLSETLQLLLLAPAGEQGASAPIPSGPQTRTDAGDPP